MYDVEVTSSMIHTVVKRLATTISVETDTVILSLMSSTGMKKTAEPSIANRHRGMKLIRISPPKPRFRHMDRLSI